jgi:alpha-1,2-mannosyltransferase
VRSVLTRPRASAGEQKTPGRWLLLAGLGAFALALGLYVIYMVIHPKNFTMDPVDLAVYRSGGLIVRHVRPLYDPRLAAPLYDWVGYGKLHLPFTYTPFAAIAFAVISFVPCWLCQQLSVAVNILALLTALWLTLGGLGYARDRVRLGATLLGAAAVFWTEPILRTIYLGQVNLVLMALIIWDLCQPDTGKSRWWKGFGTGIAAGIKLVPLVFIPYLLLARKFRQAAMACAGFAFTCCSAS